MEIRKIRRGVICITFSEAPCEPLRQIAERAYEAVGETPPPSFEITVFSKDGAALLFAEKKEVSAMHIGASRRLVTNILN